MMATFKRDMEAGPAARTCPQVVALNYTSTIPRSNCGGTNTGPVFLGAKAAGISCIHQPPCETFQPASSPSKPSSMKPMKFELYRLLIRWLLRETRQIKRVQPKPVKIKSTVPHESFPQTFVMESFFVSELITALTPGPNEEMHFLTGPKIGPIRIVTRLAAPVPLTHQSRVYAAASAKSVASVLIPIIEQGAELHIFAHSHPGRGETATTPSGTDIECVGKFQKNGSPAIGCIVTRDGYVRFFSVSTKFHVVILGTGVKEISQNVFQITNQNSH